MIEVLVIPADFEDPPSILVLTRANELPALQGAVDGFIAIRPAGPALLIFNEEARDKQLPINHRATFLFSHLLDGGQVNVLCGNVVVAGAPDGPTDEMTSCPPAIRDLLDHE